MLNLFHHLKKLDWFLIFSVFLLSLISLTFLYQLSRNTDFIYFKKELLFVVVGFFLMIIISFFDYRIFKNYPSFLIAIYFFSLLLLVGVLIFGQKIRGTTGWFSLGGLRFSPSEVTKLVLVLILAKYFSLRHIELYKFRHLVTSFVYIALPAFLIMLQPDFGSAFVLIAFWLGLVIVSGIHLKSLLVILLIGSILFSFMWSFFLKEYQKQRILTYINPHKDPLGQSYNLRQSIIAIGSGGLWGKGIGKGTQAQLGFLPEGHTDFIFAVIAEESGFVGVSNLCLIFIFLIYRIIKIGLLGSDNFSKLFALGFCLVIVFQAIINIGMNLGIIPIVGLPLPFVSYGGSATLTDFLGLGILQSIRVRS